jgi:hypothetical protein
MPLGRGAKHIMAIARAVRAVDQANLTDTVPSGYARPFRNIA